MAYLTQSQNLDGLFDWMGKIATPAAVAAAPIPAPLKVALGVKALQQSGPWMPPMHSTEPETLPPAPAPLKSLDAPGAVGQTAVTAMPRITDLVGSALRLISGSEAPMKPAAGSSHAVTAAPAPVATKMAVSASGAAPSGAPVDAETRAAVNGEGRTFVPVAGLPSWVLPVALLGGAYLLMRR